MIPPFQLKRRIRTLCLRRPCNSNGGEAVGRSRKLLIDLFGAAFERADRFWWFLGGSFGVGAGFGFGFIELLVFQGIFGFTSLHF